MLTTKCPFTSQLPRQSPLRRLIEEYRRRTLRSLPQRQHATPTTATTAQSKPLEKLYHVIQTRRIQYPSTEVRDGLDSPIGLSVEGLPFDEATKQQMTEINDTILLRVARGEMPRSPESIYEMKEAESDDLQFHHPQALSNGHVWATLDEVQMYHLTICPLAEGLSAASGNGKVYYRTTTPATAVQLFTPWDVSTGAPFGSREIQIAIRRFAIHTNFWCPLWGTPEGFEARGYRVLKEPLTVDVFDALGTQWELMSVWSCEDPAKPLRDVLMCSVAV